MSGSGTALGLVFHPVDDGVVATFRPRDDHDGLPGQLHGGLIATALDETMAAACSLISGTPFVTVTLTVRYRRLIPVTTKILWIDALRTSPRRSSRQRVQARMLLPDGVVAADATGLFVRSGAHLDRRGQAPLGDDVEATGEERLLAR